MGVASLFHIPFRLRNKGKQKLKMESIQALRIGSKVGLFLCLGLVAKQSHFPKLLTLLVYAYKNLHNLILIWRFGISFVLSSLMAKAKVSLNHINESLVIFTFNM